MEVVAKPLFTAKRETKRQRAIKENLASPLTLQYQLFLPHIPYPLLLISQSAAALLRVLALKIDDLKSDSNKKAAEALSNRQHLILSSMRGSFLPCCRRKLFGWDWSWYNMIFSEPTRRET